MRRRSILAAELYEKNYGLRPEVCGKTDVNGALICYRIFGSTSESDSGSRDTVILLHGNGEDWRCFKKQIGEFLKYYRVVAIDSRGHGSSTSGTGELTLSVMAEDVTAVMDALKIMRASIVGFSDGANIALHIALRRPERISSLVLAGANLCPGGVRLYYQLPVIISYGLLKAISLFSKRIQKKAQIMGLMVKEPKFKPADLNAINIPTLVLAGEKDMIKAVHTKLIARSIPGAKLCFIPGANHFIFDKEPELVNKKIIDFIRSNNH
jgi:pimeloyl-ACP methyl ester carboxylesterase